MTSPAAIWLATESGNRLTISGIPSGEKQEVRNEQQENYYDDQAGRGISLGFLSPCIIMRE